MNEENTTKEISTESKSELSDLLCETKTCKHKNKLFDDSRICRDCGSVIITLDE